MQLLSNQKWEDGEVTKDSPQRNEHGCVDVQKVYYRRDGEPRQSFTSSTTFHKFLTYVTGLEDGTTVDLLLWDDSSTTAPSTPEKGEVAGLCFCGRVPGELLSLCELTVLRAMLQLTANEVLA